MDAVQLRWARPGPGRIELLSPTERERYEATPPAGRARFVLGRTLLRELAGDVLGIRAAEVRVTAACPDCGGPHGRPVIEGGVLHAGLAHCAGATVAVVSGLGAVGVDAEDAAVADGRLDAIGVLTGIRSLEHWTRVEAVLKADGRGLRVDPSRVVIDGDTGRVADRPVLYRLVDKPIDPSLRVTVAVAET